MTTGWKQRVSRWKNPGNFGARKKTENGATFERDVDYMVRYLAGISVVRVAEIKDRQSFSSLVRKMVVEGSDSPQYQPIRTDFKEEIRDGLWVVSSRIDRDTWSVTSLDSHPPLAMRTAAVYAMNPEDREHLVLAWFSWRGFTFDEEMFEADASRFLNSLRKSGQ